MPPTLCSVASKPTWPATKLPNVQLQKEKNVPNKHSKKAQDQQDTTNLQVTINNSETGSQLTSLGVVLSAQPSDVLQTQTTWSLTLGPVLANTSLLPPQPQFTTTPMN